MPIGALLLLCLTSDFAPSSRYPVIPKPARTMPLPGQFSFAHPGGILYNAGAKREALNFAASMPPSAKLGGVQFTLRAGTGLPREGYALDISDRRVLATASDSAGLFYAGQTIRQLMPPASLKPGYSGGVSIPCAHIVDYPRFPWRGMHLDVSRHVYSAAFIRKYIDLLALHKMNVFHWHLVDDGGWRVEIKRYPLLTSRGAWRTQKIWGKGLVFPAERTGKEYGGFYSQAQVKQIVAYAQKRHVTIVPEIEMPGHSLPAMVCYPQLGCDKPDGSGTVVGSNYCPGKDATLQFLKNVLDEVMALFPSKFIHIGGDEVDKTDWRACPKCQARMKANGLKNEDQLQSWFVRQMAKYLDSKGRRLMGWDEILEGGLAPSASVMSWRGIDGGIQAAKAGRNVVMSPTSHCYFDYPYSSTSVEHVYSYEPVPSVLTAKQGKLVMGAQGNVWTEWMVTSRRVEQMAFPRAAALAEAVWTPKSERSWADFSRRLPAEYARLTALDVDYMPPRPSLPLNAIVTDRPTVNLKVPDLGFPLRYTTNGSQPTVRSRLLNGSTMTVPNPSVVRIAALNGLGTTGDETSISVGRLPHLNKMATSPGLSVKLYVGEFAKVPDFAKLEGVGLPMPAGIGLVGGMTENYALCFEGLIKIPSDGIYTFSLTSDDGSTLHIDNLLVVDNDGPHGPTPKAGKVSLSKGLHRLELGYFQAGGAQSLSLTMARSDGGLRQIPAAWLMHQ